MALGRWTGWAREMMRVLRGLPDEEIRRKTSAIHEELARLRKHRAIYEKEREVAALQDVRRIVDEMQTLQRNLADAEKATAEYVDTIAEQVTKDMEAKIRAEMDHMVNKAMSSDTPQKLANRTASAAATLESSGDKSKP